MFFLGLISLLQINLLPGLVVINALRIETKSIFQKSVYIFALSLISNYALVTLLVFFHIYLRQVFFVIILFEIVWLIYFISKKKIHFQKTFELNKYLLSAKNIYNKNRGYKRTIFFIAIFSILFYTSLIFANLGTPFYAIDAARFIHWNTWAIDFSNNIYPRQSHHFPQLIPSNWSISYLIMDVRDIQIFPKSFMPFFVVGIVLMFFDLGLKKRNLVYFIAQIVYSFIIIAFLGIVFIADGNADLPVAFFSFLTFYAFSIRNKEEFILKEYILIFLFATAAAATKLAGLYIFSIASLAFLYQLSRNFKNLNKLEIFKIATSIFIIFITGFWGHINNSTEMISGLSQPQYIPKSIIEIATHALGFFYYNISLPVSVFILLTIAYSLVLKDIKYITIVMVIIPLLIWIFKFSSDFRNLSFVIPFISYVSAFGVVKIIELLKRKKIDLNLEVKNIDYAEVDQKGIKNNLIVFFICLLLFVGINTNSFYNVLYNIYGYVTKYYYLNRRLVNIIDYSFFTPVDYYQKTISILFLILGLLSLFKIIRIKIKYFIIIIILILIIVVLNFTVFQKSNLVENQTTTLEKTEARHENFQLGVYFNEHKIETKVYTNFKPILKDKIERKIKYNFISEQKLNDFLTNNVNQSALAYFLLNKNILSPTTLQIIKEKFELKRIQILKEDKKFLTFTLM